MSPKNSSLHAKIAKNRPTALFNNFCPIELFATLYNTVLIKMKKELTSKRTSVNMKE